MHTGQVVELEVAKQGAIFHGLATLLSQPSPVMSPRSAGQVGPGPNKVTQSKSMSAMPSTAFQQQHEQHTYQNHRPDYPPPPPQGGGSMGPQGPHPPPPSAINANRSTSVGNLTIPRYVVTSNNKHGNQILHACLVRCFYFSTGFGPIFGNYIKRICRNRSLKPKSF